MTGTRGRLVGLPAVRSAGGVFGVLKRVGFWAGSHYNVKGGVSIMVLDKQRVSSGYPREGGRLKILILRALVIGEIYIFFELKLSYYLNFISTEKFRSN